MVQQLIGLALPLGLRAASPVDVGACTRVPPVEKEHAGPDVDRLIELAAEIVVESCEQELLYARCTRAATQRICRAVSVGRERIRHQGRVSPLIIRPKPRIGQRAMGLW